MGQEIAISVAREETRVAVLDNGVVTDLYSDRIKHKDFVGNIYKGRVAKVLPGMQAAFIDIGMEKAAFMHVSDLSTEADFGDTLLDTEDDEEKGSEMPRPRRQSSKPIEQLLTPGQEVMVQISKGPIGTKGPRVTTYVSLPGRYLVFMPNVEHIGVSRRIPRDDERARLKDIMRRMRRPGFGYIVRTVSEGVKEEELRSDVEFLHVLWQDILAKRERPAPAMLHTDLSLSFRVVRDLFGKRVDRLWIDSKAEYQAIRDFVERFSPEQTSKVHYYEKSEPLFDALGIEQEITRALSRKVWLKSGGYIVIDHTEAMTVIDVNTGRFVGKRDQEETILRNNLEAVKEIAYQIKLRGIGGIIIIDFIDMEREKNRERVYQAFVDAMSTDKARSRISRISDLGLIELSRERVREDLLRAMSEPCRYCEGRGYTKSPTTVAYELFRELRRVGDTADNGKIVVGTHPSVADLLQEEERQGLDEIEQQLHVKVIVMPDEKLHLEQFDIVVL
jgi:ribonuclease G